MKFITPIGRLNYPNLYVPTSFSDEQKKNYSLEFIFEEKDLKKIEDEVDRILKDAKDEKDKKWSSANKAVAKENFLKDLGEDEENNLKGYYSFRAKNYAKPTIYRINKTPITEEEKDEIYSGCLAKLCVEFGIYNVAGNKGIRAKLFSVMKFADGEPIEPQISADVFDVDDEDTTDEWMN